MDIPSRFPDRLNLGGPTSDSKVSLCIYAPDIDLDAVSALLGCSPTRAQRRGEVIGRRPPARVGLWSLDAPPSLAFERQLQYLLDNTTSDLAVWSALALSHDIQLRCAVFLNSWSEGFDLSADLVAAVGMRRWALGVSMYSAGGDEILESFLGGPKSNDESEST